MEKAKATKKPFTGERALRNMSVLNSVEKIVPQARNPDIKRRVVVTRL
jgi:hypothetical protein